jgi:hypothetical protein
MKFSLIVLIIAILSFEAWANDVEPRLYSNVPTGVNFLTIGYANSSGEVAFDNSIPITEADGNIDAVVLSYSRGLNIAGKSGLLTIAVPYANVRLTGKVLGEPASGKRLGLGDPQVRLAINFYGAPAMSRRKFPAYQQRTIIGGSISVGMPFGRYLDDRILNVGNNRWSFVAQSGISHRVNQWTVESALGVAWFTDNDEFVGDRVLEQNPIGLLRATAIYNFTPGFWVGAGFVYAYGGESTVEGIQRHDRQKNTRSGISASIQLAPRHRLLLRVTNGLVARIGADFTTYSASYTLTF